MSILDLILANEGLERSITIKTKPQKDGGKPEAPLDASSANLPGPVMEMLARSPMKGQIPMDSDIWRINPEWMGGHNPIAPETQFSRPPRGATAREADNMRQMYRQIYPKQEPKSGLNFIMDMLMGNESVPLPDPDPIYPPLKGIGH